MKKISVAKSSNESFSAQLVSLYQTFKGVQAKERVIFDLSDIDWLFPLLTLPLGAYIHSTKSQYVLAGLNIKTYLKTIKFPNGVDSLASYQPLKTYLPILRLRKNSDNEREKFLNMIFKVLRPSRGSISAINYPMHEMVNNIFEHSGRDEGFVFGQYYPNKRYVDLCKVY